MEGRTGSPTQDMMTGKWKLGWRRGHFISSHQVIILPNLDFPIRINCNADVSVFAYLGAKLPLKAIGTYTFLKAERKVTHEEMNGGWGGEVIVHQDP